MRPTEGPWKVGRNSIESDAMPSWRELNPRASDPPDSRAPVCSFRQPSYEWPLESVERLNRINESNARLIAASPDLLFACQALIEAYDRGEESGSVEWEDLDHAYTLAQQAIAKAKGRDIS